MDLEIAVTHSFEILGVRKSIISSFDEYSAGIKHRKEKSKNVHE